MLKYYSTSNYGNRQCNEDSLRVSIVGDQYCFVVCDGLGGHELGNVASDLVSSVFAEEFNDCEIESFLPKTFEIAQNELVKKQKELQIQNAMKTTAVVFTTDGKQGFVGNIGDSRFYGFNKDGEYIRTLDHSVPQVLVESNTIKEDEIRNHPSRSMLLKVMGDNYDEQICDLFEPFLISDYKAFLLCTDGFWELITEDEMKVELTNSNSPQEWLDKMIEIVQINGKDKDMDNYTAIAIFTE